MYINPKHQSGIITTFFRIGSNKNKYEYTPNFISYPRIIQTTSDFKVSDIFLAIYKILRHNIWWYFERRFKRRGVRNKEERKRMNPIDEDLEENEDIWEEMVINLML